MFLRKLAFLSSMIATEIVRLTPVTASELPIRVDPFCQQVHVPYLAAQGLPEDSFTSIGINPDGQVIALSKANDSFVFQGGSWQVLEQSRIPTEIVNAAPWYESLTTAGLSRASVNDVAIRNGEIAVAAREGLFTGDGHQWEMALPTDGKTRWAPIDVRAVAYDNDGLLWFAAPQGVGCRLNESDWQLFTGQDGLPFNDFTCMATGPTGVWFGTTNGAIQFYDGQWKFRQGQRWLVDNHVNHIFVDDSGDAWIATRRGVSRIQCASMTLREKAQFYEREIDKYHRRTELGYVNPATLSVPGDKSSAKARFSDNDGFNTGLYLAAMSFAYAATGDENYLEYAHDAFQALAFLSEVTQGGPYGGPEGLIARNVVPTTEPDPGTTYDEEYDRKRNERDKLWKIMERRVPIDESGEWYWKADASSDELDGHFFGSAVYFDLVCKSEQEKDAVRAVVRRIVDHLIKHGYNLVDYDGIPTRWARFSPNDLNRNPAWHSERGLNSYSILTYLSIAHHILGDQMYREEYLKLAFEHGYGMNGMTQPKELPGPDSPGHQPDDNMAFMNYYHLIRYETDPTLLSMYQYAIREHWKYERLERNAFTNFVYGTVARGKSRTDHWRTVDLSPPLECYEDAVDTLKRYPLDLIEWPMSNAHRIDMNPMERNVDGAPDTGSDVFGYAFPVDERQEVYWDWNYWKLSYGGDGTTLRPGHHYLLAYYMGLFHEFFQE